MKFKISSIHRAVILLFLLSAWFVCLPVRAQETADEFFTFSELKTLYEQENLSPPLENKLNYLLTTPFVDNSYRSATPLRFSKSAKGGEFLRVAEWNIERGLEYKALEAVFGDPKRFEALLDTKKFPKDGDERREILEQAATLRSADVIILNEVDFGLKRTEYRNIAADLAAHLGMNYAFGVQFVELSPVHLSEELGGASEEEREFAEFVRVDPTRYKGLHGIAILSRLPLENVRLVPFKEKSYDWYRTEKNGASLLEKSKRKVADKIFLEKTLREVRRGGRTMLLADITDARFPNGRVTIAATHLENRTKSLNRVKQLKELLDLIKSTSHPVIVAGDMNTSSSDLTPTSIRRELFKRYGKPEYWIRKGIGYALGVGLIEDTLFDGLIFWRKQSDPTVRHVPLLMPNSEHRFFSTLEDFRFDDGGAFDFRGDKEHSANKKSKTLANSNERGSKGFVTTFQVSRPIKFIGKYKLDWIFVKPADLKKPNDRNASYRFAPRFGRTLDDVNEVIEDRISDHRPIIVDLPFN